MDLKVIAYARNGHSDKFGIPRQSREDSPIETRIVFEPGYDIPEALRGIEGFSHLWLIWGFSENYSEQHKTSTKPAQNQHKHTITFQPTVRPPRLGGNKRMGVFATRSPFRPNPIGLSSVRLIEVRMNDVRGTTEKRMELIVAGADLMDGTPIYDIKPYLSFSDCHPEAQGGFADAHKDDSLEVDWSIYLRQRTDNEPTMDRQWTDAVSYILSQDPRPAYQDDPQRAYKLDYAGYTVTFTVDAQMAYIRNIEPSK